MAYPNDLTRSKNWGTEVLTDTDLEGQLDLIINWVMAALNASTGHTHDGTSNQGPKLSSSGVTATFLNGLTTVSVASGDYLALADVSDSNNNKKGLVSDIITLSAPTVTNAVAGSVIQTVKTTTASYASLGNTTVPLDDTIPTWAEGNAISSLDTTITPNSNSNYLIIDVCAHISLTGTSSNFVAMSIYQDPSGTDAAKSSVAMARTTLTGTTPREVRLRYIHTSPGTSATTFKLRVGGDAGDTLVINGKADATAGRILGGALVSSVVIREIKG